MSTQALLLLVFSLGYAVIMIASIYIDDEFPLILSWCGFTLAIMLISFVLNLNFDELDFGPNWAIVLCCPTLVSVPLTILVRKKLH